ncbi:MAG: hypothetical protein J5691_06625 [Bacilli bacterium]|nr:hypothetical protein [Bacilli bacterium]
MSEAFLGKEQDLKNKISLQSNSGGIKVINIDDYLEDINKRFKRIIKEVTNEAESKALFLDFIALKNNIDEVYMPSGDMDEYTLERINRANELLCEIYGLILSKSPTIYTSQIQYFAYNSLFDSADHMIFYRHLFDVVKDNFEVARYTVGVFKEIIFVHYDLDINGVIKDNVTELIELLTKLCNDANLDVNEELEGLID